MTPSFGSSLVRAGGSPKLRGVEAALQRASCRRDRIVRYRLHHYAISQILESDGLHVPPPTDRRW
jgi:hypothetical protein